MVTHTDSAKSRNDGRVMMRTDWRGYEALLDLRGERRYPRMAYLDGELELTMSPSAEHESIEWMLAVLLCQYWLLVGTDCRPRGGPTMRTRLKGAGLEPDASFVMGPRDKRFPDLAIEVNWSRGGIDKLKVYRRLATREVWFWEKSHVTVYALQRGRYVEHADSRWVPRAHLDVICRLADTKGTFRELVARMRAKLDL